MLMSRNKREGRYGGIYKGKHYRSEYCLRHFAAERAYWLSPEGKDWLEERNKWEKNIE